MAIRPADHGIFASSGTVSDVGTGNGYGMGGYDTSGSPNWYNDEINKLVFASEASSVISSVLSSRRYFLAGASHNSTAGYAMGGRAAGDIYPGTIDKMLYADEAVSTLVATLGGGEYDACGFADSPTAGYNALGYDGDTASNVDTITKLTFASGALTTVSDTLSAARGSAAGYANYQVAGFVIGGSNSQACEKMLFATEATSVLSATIGAKTHYIRGMSNSGVAGYAAGGEQWGVNDSETETYKLTYSTEAISTINLPLARAFGATCSNTGVAGYYLGGLNESNDAYTDTIFKCAWPSDTMSTLSETLDATGGGTPARCDSEAGIG